MKLNFNQLSKKDKDGIYDELPTAAEYDIGTIRQVQRSVDSPDDKIIRVWCKFECVPDYRGKHYWIPKSMETI